MIVTIQYYMVVEGKKVIIVNAPKGFPSRIDVSAHFRPDMSEDFALALAMGENNRTKSLVLPTGILFEKAP